MTESPRTDHLPADPLPNAAMLIAAVAVLAGAWLLILGRRGRKSSPRDRVERVAESVVAPPTAARPAEPDERADPWIQVSDLERAIGGRFELPSLDMNASEAPSGLSTAPSSAGASSSLPVAIELPPSPAPAEPPSVPATSAPAPDERRQRLARSLALAESCVQRNDSDLARHLLEDVVRSGDADQQNAARALLARLG